MSGLGAAVRWIICLAALTISCLALALSIRGNDDSVHRDMLLCKASGKNAAAVNEAHTSIYNLIDTGLQAALGRIGTPKELPSDKKIVKIYTGFLKGIHTTTPLDCKVLHG